eukprot:600974_1
MEQKWSLQTLPEDILVKIVSDYFCVWPPSNHCNLRITCKAFSEQSFRQKSRFDLFECVDLLGVDCGLLDWIASRCLDDWIDVERLRRDELLFFLFLLCELSLCVVFGVFGRVFFFIGGDECARGGELEINRLFFFGGANNLLTWS